MAILTGIFHPGFFPFLECFLVAGTAEPGVYIIRIAVSGVWRGDKIVRAVHLAVHKVTGHAVDTIIAPIQPGAGFFPRYRLWDMASQAFFFGAIFRRFNISFADPGDGVSTFLPRLINILVAFRATFGIRSL